jgi:uncharacterized protein (DUF1697 family)
MSQHVAFLRGINVGRNKRVAMADLRTAVTRLGFTDVKTLLNSGNVVFTGTPAAARRAPADLQAVIASDLGVECAVVVRSAAEVTGVMATAPLLDVATNPSRHFVGFLADVPSAGASRAIAAIDVAPDLIRLVGREVYLWCPGGLLDSPLAKQGWEKALGTPVTVRNWTTVTKVAALLRDECG